MKYDASHAITAIIDNLGNRVEYDYDLKGNQTEQRLVNAQGVIEQQSQYDYDIRDRIQQMQNGESITQLNTDAAGQLRSFVDPNENPEAYYEYDTLGRLTSAIDTLSQQTQYRYNVADQIIEVTSPNGAATQFSYDDLGNQQQETSPDRGITQYAHDAAGNVISSTDARNITTRYQYDALNRLISVMYPDSDENVTFDYDTGKNCGISIGRLCATTQKYSKIAYEYDSWGNISRQVQRIGKHDYTLRYAYDKGNRISSITYPNGDAISYQRDVLGRITGVNQGPRSLISNRAYRADGAFTEQTYGNGMQEQRRYNAQGRLIQQQLDQQLNQYYEYDDNGNILKKGDDLFGYDGLNRLVNDGKQEYSYDGNGNRLAATVQSKDEIGYYSHSNQVYSVNEIKLEE